jgi:Resolvase, N terminal domain
VIRGYARVSDGQSVDAQVKQLRAAGAEKVWREKASGAKTDRAQLHRVLAQLDAGDVLMVTRLRLRVHRSVPRPRVRERATRTERRQKLGPGGLSKHSDSRNRSLIPTFSPRAGRRSAPAPGACASHLTGWRD